MTTSVTDLSLEAKATRWGEALIASAITRRPVEYIANSTYNEALDFLPQEHIDTNEIAHVGWVGMGIGSDYMQSIPHPITGDVIENPTKYIHSNEDAVPFIIMPYVLREEGKDNLSKTERDKLSGRCVMIINGKRYIAYTLRSAELSNDKVTINKVTTDSTGNIIGNEPLEPSQRPLKPVRDPNFVGQAASTNEYLQIRSSISISLTPNDISEILNVAAIMFGATDIEITEFSIVGGINKSHVVVDGGTNITYDEVIGAQSTHFSPVSFSAAQRVDVGVDITFQIGQSLPMA